MSSAFGVLFKDESISTWLPLKSALINSNKSLSSVNVAKCKVVSCGRNKSFDGSIDSELLERVGTLQT